MAEQAGAKSRERTLSLLMVRIWKIRPQKVKGFEKKGPSSCNVDRKTGSIRDPIKGRGFCVSQDGPDLYLKALKRLGLYLCTTHKNEYDLQICLDPK